MTGFLCKTSQITRVEVSFWLVVWLVEGNISTYFKHFESVWRYSGHHLLILQLPSSLDFDRSWWMSQDKWKWRSTNSVRYWGPLRRTSSSIGRVKSDQNWWWVFYQCLLLCINEVWDGPFKRLLARTCSSQGSDASPFIEWPFLSIYSPCLLCTPGFVADVLKFVGEIPISFTFSCSWAFSWFQPFHPFSVDCS